MYSFLYFNMCKLLDKVETILKIINIKIEICIVKLKIMKINKR